MNLDLGGSYSHGTEAKGVSVALEPTYRFSPKLGVGVRAEAVVSGGGSVGDSSSELDMGAAGSLLVKGEYHFTEGKVRPFAGGGMGMYAIAAQSIATQAQGTSISQEGGQYFGIAPQVGVEFGRVRLVATYNLILGASTKVTNQVTTGGQAATATADVSQHYVSLALGFRFGN